MYNVEKWPNILWKSCLFIPQDFQDMFGHFSTLSMKGLIPLLNNFSNLSVFLKKNLSRVFTLTKFQSSPSNFDGQVSNKLVTCFCFTYLVIAQYFSPIYLVIALFCVFWHWDLLLLLNSKARESFLLPNLMWLQII